MRRIIENYFKIMGQKPDDYILSKFETQEKKIVCESLLYWINDRFLILFMMICTLINIQILAIFLKMYLKQIFETII